MSGAIVAAGLFAAVALALVTDSGPCNVQIADNTTSADCTLAPGGALISYIGSSDTLRQSSGTGTFDPFVRLQGSPIEKGYNTDGNVAFETKSGKWTHAILASAIPVVNVGGLDYWELFVDINETNSAKHVSLNEVEVWFTTNPDLIGFVDASGFPSGATKQYDFSGEILINDVNEGSGRGDLRYLIPIAGISWSASDYFVLYSKWGTSANVGSINYASDGGFEEWKVRKVPPPPSLILDKVVIRDNGGTAAESLWNLTATGTVASPTNLSGPGAAGSADVVSSPSFKADTYTLAETGTVSGYTNGTTYSCVKTPAGGVAGAPVVSNSITLNNGDSAVCTITNTDDKASPAIKTAQGWALFDTANFTGIVAGAPDAASATVTFKLWSTNTAGVCSGLLGTRTESLSGSSATTATGIVVTPTTSPTTFYWTAEYSGDQFNNSATSACGTETTTISWVQPAP
jgi:hypothetical protein